MMKILVFSYLICATISFAYGIGIKQKGDYRKPHEADCFSYYQCNSQGICDVINCGRNQEFNARLLKCIHSNGSCKRERVEQGAINENCPELDDPKNPIHLPHGNDCTKYYACANKRAILRSCPNGLHWNIRADLCDYPLRSSCVLNCPDQQQAYLPHKSDCGKFYVCLANKPISLNCPFGLYWNIEKNACDLKSRVVCIRK